MNKAPPLFDTGLLRFYVEYDRVHIEASDTYDGFSWTMLDREQAEHLRDWLNEFLATGEDRSNG